MIKDCKSCIYDTVCPQYRRFDSNITDCFIPEKPLRFIQKQVMCNTVQDEMVSRYAEVTKEYIKKYKNKSTYWKSEQY